MWTGQSTTKSSSRARMDICSVSCPSRSCPGEPSLGRAPGLASAALSSRGGSAAGKTLPEAAQAVAGTFSTRVWCWLMVATAGCILHSLPEAPCSRFQSGGCLLLQGIAFPNRTRVSVLTSHEDVTESQSRCPSRSVCAPHSPSVATSRPCQIISLAAFCSTQVPSVLHTTRMAGEV